MHVAPNPGPPIKKVHDCSFDRAKTLMRTIETEGQGEEARGRGSELCRWGLFLEPAFWSVRLSRLFRGLDLGIGRVAWRVGPATWSDGG